MRFADQDPLNRSRFPIDEWALVETEFGVHDMGRTETLFAVGNGYLGLRGNVEEGRDGYMHGTFVNGFHETWPIRHAEEAFGFARVGQTIVNAPDAKVIALVTQTQAVLEAKPQALELLATLFAGKTDAEGKALLETLERSGAALYRRWADSETDPAAREELLRGAEREDQNAETLRRLLGR